MRKCCLQRSKITADPKRIDMDDLEEIVGIVVITSECGFIIIRVILNIDGVRNGCSHKRGFQLDIPNLRFERHV